MTFTRHVGRACGRRCAGDYSDQLLGTVWNQMPAWAIIPFEQIEPKWKVLMIDGQSPIVSKNFDPIITVDCELSFVCGSMPGPWWAGFLFPKPRPK